MIRNLNCDNNDLLAGELLTDASFKNLRMKIQNFKYLTNIIGDCICKRCTSFWFAIPIQVLDTE